MTVPDDFERMWPTSRRSAGRRRRGGYFRQPFTPRRARAARLVRRAVPRPAGCAVEADGIGNVVAWWRPGGSAGPGVLTGSHLDSVLDGGAYDGPLGVVSALAAIDVLRERGFVPARPIGVAVFVEEEGSRFGLACLGSRLATGAMIVGRRRGSCGTGTAWRFGDVGGRAAVVGRCWPDVGVLRRAARRAGPRPGRPRRGGRGGQRDLAARALPVRLHGRGQPRRHDADGGPRRPDADLRDDRAGRQQAGPAGRAAGDVRPGRGDAQRHQRRAVAGDRLAGRAVRVRRRRWPSWSRPIDAAGDGAGRARRHLGGGDAPSRCPGRSPSTPTLAAADRRRPRRTATGRSSRPRPATTPGSCPRPGSRPRCCSSATRPASRTRRPSTPRCPTAWSASHALADTLERLATVTVGVPAGAGVGRRRRPRRRAGRDRGRAVHRSTSRSADGLHPTSRFTGDR